MCATSRPPPHRPHADLYALAALRRCGGGLERATSCTAVATSAANAAAGRCAGSLGRAAAGSTARGSHRGGCRCRLFASSPWLQRKRKRSRIDPSVRPFASAAVGFHGRATRHLSPKYLTGHVYETADLVSLFSTRMRSMTYMRVGLRWRTRRGASTRARLPVLSSSRGCSVVQLGQQVTRAQLTARQPRRSRMPSRIGALQDGLEEACGTWQRNYHLSASSGSTTVPSAACCATTRCDVTTRLPTTAHNTWGCYCEAQEAAGGGGTIAELTQNEQNGNFVHLPSAMARLHARERW